jgi:medium-chain acyl-[acyl-carrier-protein] hydrolase
MGALLSFEVMRQLHRNSLGGPKQLFVSGRGAPQLPEKEPPKHNLPDAEFTEELRRLNGTPKEILENEEVMEYMIPLLRADFAICETYTYTPGAPFDCPITALGGLQDVEVTRDRLDAWREQTTGKFRLRMFSGDHFFIQTVESLLLQTLNQELHSLLKATS